MKTDEEKVRILIYVIMFCNGSYVLLSLLLIQFKPGYDYDWSDTTSLLCNVLKQCTVPKR